MEGRKREGWWKGRCEEALNKVPGKGIKQCMKVCVHLLRVEKRVRL